MSVTAGLFLLLFNSFCTGLFASLFAYHIRWKKGIYDILLWIFLWIFITSFYVLIFGIIGILTSWFITIVSCTICIFLLISFRDDFGKIIVLYCKCFKAAKSGISERKWLAAGLSLLVLFLMVRQIVHIVFWPPYIWDVLTYHLPKVADWILHNKIVVLETAVTRSYWPANFELLQTWFAVFLHHDVIIETAGIPYYILAIGSVYAICRTLIIGRTLALFLAIIFAYTPAIVLGAVSGKNDIVVAACYLYIIALLLDARTQNTCTSNRFLIILLAFALSLGAKPYIVFLLPGLVIIAIYSIFQNAENDAESEMHTPSIPLGKGTLAVSFLGFFVIGFFWYIRNWIYFNNPFYPSQFELFGETIFPGDKVVQQGTFDFHSLNVDMLHLFATKILDRGAYNPDLPNMTGWGWFSFSVGIPCLIFCAMKNGGHRWILAGFTVSFISLLAWVAADPWNMRFAIWFPAVFVISYGLVWKSLRFRFIKISLALLSLVGIGLNFIGVLSNGYASDNNWKDIGQIAILKRTAAHQSSEDQIRLRKIIQNGYSHSGYHVFMPIFLYESEWSTESEYTYNS